jgi:hypothetical protein
MPEGRTGDRRACRRGFHNWRDARPGQTGFSVQADFRTVPQVHGVEIIPDYPIKKFLGLHAITIREDFTIFLGRSAALNRKIMTILHDDTIYWVNNRIILKSGIADDVASWEIKERLAADMSKNMLHNDEFLAIRWILAGSRTGIAVRRRDVALKTF